MPRPKVYLTREVTTRVLDRLREVCDIRRWDGSGRCPAEVLAKEAAEVDGILGTDRWTAPMLENAARLRVIALTSVGYDMVDVRTASRCQILVTNTPDVLTDTVADLTLALILAAARRVCEMERWMRQGHWKTPGATPMGRDVHHTILGIVGLGRIGRAVAERARGFHMQVWYCDFLRRKDLEEQFGYRFVDLETLFREADFISLHVPLSPETKGMIGATQLSMVKPSAYLVNTSRGPVVDEQALIAALQKGHIEGAALDVYETEPLDLSSPLFRMDNVVILPHVGSATEATRQAMVELAADNLLAVLQDRPPLTPVNPEVLPVMKARRGDGI